MRRIRRFTVSFARPEPVEGLADRANAERVRVLTLTSPFPLEDSLPPEAGRGWPTTWVAAAAGVAGSVTAIWFQNWVMQDSWPLNIGGRPGFAGPALAPVAFEVGVLCAGLAAFIHFVAGGLRRRVDSADGPADEFVVVLEVVDPRQLALVREWIGELRPLWWREEDLWQD